MRIFFKYLVLVSVSIFFFSVNCIAESYQDYLKAEKNSFQTYRDERDNEFIGFLKDQWKEFKVNQGLIQDLEPKPVKLPVARPVKSEPVSIAKSKPIKTIIVPDYVPAKKTVIKPAPAIGKKPVAIKINFYLTPLAVYGTYAFPDIMNGTVDKNMITDFWDKMSQIDYDSFVAQVLRFKKELKLNDWGYHHVLYRFGMAQFAQNKNMANLFVWFMSTKSGYETRIGYNNSHIYLLMPSRNRLYSVPFLTLKERKYYSLTFDEKPKKFKSLYTYKGRYPKASRLMDYRILNSPEISKTINAKKLKFTYRQKDYVIQTQFNKNLVTFFKYYPQTNIKVYFDALVSDETKYTLIKSLKPLVENKTEAEAVNILLRFVQKSFKYKTDDMQFGREKYLLPEETLYYPYSDCEDRSIFFAFLVKELVGLDVVGLDYPGHIATAVKFSNNFSGDYVVRNNKKYMICDPTYINARFGMAMPKFKKIKPEIVRISSL